MYSSYLIYLQFFKLNRFCTYCLISAITSTILFGIMVARIVTNS
ncbi:MAG: hypothetical protein IH840_07595 [Candidatus Heimdallarchaeota archaeon]|nr:hypothetical protein [Candidatus Heimdallarchaeota archaeon]